MAKGVDLDRMRDAARVSRIEWQRHALERMTEREIRRSDALNVILSGELVEEYPDDQPFPSALLLGWIGSRPLHVLAAFDAGSEHAFVITAYEPDLEHFEADFKTRRTV